MNSMADKKINDKKRSYLVSPNLGKPLILKTSMDSKTETFKTCLLFISDLTNILLFENTIRKKISFIPLFGYKSRFRTLTKKIRRKGFSKFWNNLKQRVKRLFSKDEEKKLKRKGWKRAIRGKPIKLKIGRIIETSITSIGNSKILNEESCIPREELLEIEPFGLLTKFYKVYVSFKLTKESYRFLKHRNFLMFDIQHEESKNDVRINSHALVISKNEWKTFKFVHITDLHLADRNDLIYGLIRQWIKEIRKNNIALLSEINEGEEDYDLDKFSEIDLSYRRRIINPNNLFRKFIKEMNKKVFKNEIDFIILTGDIVDFTNISTISKDLVKENDYQYSNWRIFKEIVLNSVKSQRKGTKRNEELLCPIFTITGNHDYRPWHYDLRWAGIYKKIGLHENEAKAIKDYFSANPIKSITKDNFALKGYLKEICPYLNYSMRLGKNLFIFLDSGADSYKKLRDFVSGSPSLTGLRDDQILFLENLINEKIKDNDNVFLCLHSPPINPKKKKGIQHRVKKWFGYNQEPLRIDEYKESKREKNEARIDDKFNIKYGITAFNWQELMNFCANYSTLTLTGHTHAINEFRLKPFHESSQLDKIDHPLSSKEQIAVFFDDFSKRDYTRKRVKRSKPYVLQTPPIGMGTDRNPNKIGAYRIIKIKRGEIASFKVKYLKKRGLIHIHGSKKKE